MNDNRTGAPALDARRRSPGRTRSPANGRSPVFSEEVFTALLTRERTRAERSRQPVALLRLDVRHALGAPPRDPALGGLLGALAASTRETDIWGWSTEDAVIGVMLTELGAADPRAVRDRVLAQVRAVLHAHLGPAPCAQIRWSFSVFPRTLGPQNGNGDSDDHRLDALGAGQEKGGGDRLVRAPRGRAWDVPAILQLLWKRPVL